MKNKRNNCIICSYHNAKSNPNTHTVHGTINLSKQQYIQTHSLLIIMMASQTEFARIISIRWGVEISAAKWQIVNCEWSCRLGASRKQNEATQRATRSKVNCVPSADILDILLTIAYTLNYHANLPMLLIIIIIVRNIAPPYMYIHIFSRDYNYHSSRHLRHIKVQVHLFLKR